MDKVNIKFSSITHALRAKEIIEKSGGKVTVKKNTNPRKGEGCCYSVTFYGDSDLNKYLNILKINQIKYTGIGYL